MLPKNHPSEAGQKVNKNTNGCSKVAVWYMVKYIYLYIRLMFMARVNVGRYMQVPYMDAMEIPYHTNIYLGRVDKNIPRWCVL